MHPIRHLIRLVETAMTEEVWHGNGLPDPIDQFSTAFMSTGEGGQEWGWGLYFSSRREVAEWYRGSITALRLSQDLEQKFGGDGRIVASYVRHAGLERAREILTREPSNPQEVAALAYLEDLIRQKGGRLYQVQIPDEGQYFLWDKRLAEQPPKVLAALKKMARRVSTGNVTMLGDGYGPAEPLFGNIHNVTGEEFYQRLTRQMGSPKDASLYMLSKGIVGIKYLDGASRDAGDGHYNYVVFDGDATQIKSVE